MDWCLRYQRAVEKVLKNLEGMKNYQDDVLFGLDAEEHDKLVTDEDEKLVEEEMENDTCICMIEGMVIVKAKWREDNN
ncbi:hypothetical protein NDU88_005151 [Pleurodeles waltl]|uniref:Uncharacterized protein n=1 Tax=Pleurodeles waltl TaxID=8319 RepID=A0AAV7SL13_PLEWA|nr:hypothetical protein NDU88_005151 [Pleurodeles waltl]